MTDPEELPPDAEEQEEDAAISALLKRAVAPEAAPEPQPERPVLPEVQRKLRQRSKGKFYSDGWSTTSSRINYALVAVIMLLIVAAAYFALGPMAVTK